MSFTYRKQTSLNPPALAQLDSLAEFFAGLSRAEQSAFAVAAVALLLIDQTEETQQAVLRAARALQAEFEESEGPP